MDGHSARRLEGPHRVPDFAPDFSAYCLEGVPDSEPKPSHGNLFTKNDLLQMWEHEPHDPGAQVSREQGLKDIGELRPEDVKALNDYAAAIGKEPPDFDRVRNILDHYKCDPERLTKLALPLDLVSDKWGVVVSKIDPNGDLTLEIFRSCISRQSHDWIKATATPSLTFKANMNRCVG
jgi:hypothetical protein